MSAEINHKGNLKIEEYEFGAFLQAFQDAVLNGYVLDLETNDHYPNKFGSMMEVTLVSTNFQPVDEKVEEVQEVEEKVTAQVEVAEVQPTEEKPVETTTRKRKNSAT